MLKRDHINVNIFPATSRYYTQYKGKRCALPLLADATGLYYNKTLFRKAGLTEPPKTLSELVGVREEADEKNKDGSIKILGFNPNQNFYMGGYGNGASGFQPLIGASYFDKSGKSSLGHPTRRGRGSSAGRRASSTASATTTSSLAGRRGRRVRARRTRSRPASSR